MRSNALQTTYLVFKTFCIPQILAVREEPRVFQQPRLIASTIVSMSVESRFSRYCIHSPAAPSQKPDLAHTKSWQNNRLDLSESNQKKRRWLIASVILGLSFVSGSIASHLERIVIATHNWWAGISTPPSLAPDESHWSRFREEAQF